MFEYYTSSVDLYARVLFDYTKEHGLLDAMQAEISKIKSCLDADKGLIELIAAPIYSAKERQVILQKLVKTLELSKDLDNFLKFMVKNDKLHLLRKVIDDFNVIATKAQGLKLVEVTVADQLSEQEQNKIKQQLEKVLLSKIKISFKLDPKIIGGIIVRLDNKMLDTSIATKLFSLSEAINNKIAELN